MPVLKKLVYKDCIKALKSCFLLNVLYVIVSDFVIIFTADKLGRFAESIFDLQMDYAMQNIGEILVCLLIMIIGVPLLLLLTNFFLFRDSLQHDSMLYGRFLSKEYMKAKAIEEGEIGARLEMDPVWFRLNGLETMSYVVVLPFTLNLLLSKALAIDVIFCIITFTIALTKLGVPIWVRKLEAKYDLQNREYKTQVKTYEIEMSIKPHMINLLGIKKSFIQQFDKLFQNYYQETLRKDIRCKSISSQIEESMKTLTLLIILIVGAVMIARGQIQPGGVVAMMGYLTVFDEVLKKVSFIIKKVPIMKNLADRLLFFYTDEENLKGQELVGEITTIKLENLTFAYEMQSNLLENINLRVNPYDKVAICGPNGTGKSTLIKLISGLTKGYQGKIEINGIDFHKLSPKAIREKIAFVEQNPYIFKGTVTENIHIGNLQATSQMLHQVMEQVGILHLKDRKIENLQSNLSGGEKQRIAIARALIRDKNLIIMDEPNNHLDQEGLRWLGQFIQTYQQKTFLFVSHNDILTNYANKKIEL